MFGMDKNKRDIIAAGTTRTPERQNTTDAFTAEPRLWTGVWCPRNGRGHHGLVDPQGDHDDRVSAPELLQARCEEDNKNGSVIEPKHSALLQPEPSPVGPSGRSVGLQELLNARKHMIIRANSLTRRPHFLNSQSKILLGKKCSGSRDPRDSGGKNVIGAAVGPGILSIHSSEEPLFGRTSPFSLSLPSL